jgi:hypothetical protein
MDLRVKGHDLLDRDLVAFLLSLCISIAQDLERSTVDEKLVSLTLLVHIWQSLGDKLSLED